MAVRAALLLPLLVACGIRRVEWDGGFTSYTHGGSIPIYGPDGAVGDNEPEFGLTFVIDRPGHLDWALRLSGGEGTLTYFPQRKITMHSASWSLRREHELLARLRFEWQAGLRIGWGDRIDSPDVGPEIGIGIRLHPFGRRLSLALLAAYWLTPHGDLPHQQHPRIAIGLGWDF